MSSTTSKVPNPASHIFHILPEDTHMFSKWAYIYRVKHPRCHITAIIWASRRDERAPS